MDTPPLSLPAVILSAGHYSAQAARHPFRTFWRTVIAPRFWLFACFIVVILGSQLAFLVEPVAGVYATVAALAVCIGFAACMSPVRQAALAVGTIPAAVMVALCVPTVTPFGRVAVFYMALLVLSLVYCGMFSFAGTRDRLRSAVGIVGYGKALPTMLVLGQLCGLLAYALLGHQYPYSGTPFAVVVAGSVAFAFAEESAFRGLIQKYAGTVMNPGLAAALSALLFASLAIGQGSWASAVTALILGGILATVYYKTHNLLLTVTLNITTKVTYLLVLATYGWRYF